MEKFFNILNKIVDGFVAFLMFLLITIGGVQVFSRYVFNYPLTWSEELSRYILIWMVFLAIGVGFRKNAHLGMDTVVQKFSLTVQKSLALLSCVIAIVFAGVVIYYSSQLVQATGGQTTPALEIPMVIVYFGMVLGGVYLIVLAVKDCVEKLRTFKAVKDGEKQC